ncbi:unnamed protein product [Acanthocheilonema viteae]|uniref:Transthyretin/hydroxyisourate hydrolase domain-containing protein n=1 Tax=Acanthocheilonema viteae TaxID=6277 RepID=A0A498SXT9_ACAVI|nr:unnamed protein product [Acanthocheilonema viteae]
MWLVFSLGAYIIIGMVHTANAFLEQSVRVKGRLLCGSQPASSILVKLVDKDNGVTSDDLMASSYTDSGGKFDLHGNSYELSTIDPEIRIYHDCNDYGRGPSLAVNRLTLKPEQSAQWQHQLFRLRPARHGGDAEERNVKGRTVVLTSKSHREKVRNPWRYNWK